MFASALESGPIDAGLAALPSPRIVFVGAILAATMDIDLVVALARLRPKWSFAFVGPVGQGDPRTNIDALREPANVHLLGPRPYDRLPEVHALGDGEPESLGAVERHVAVTRRLQRVDVGAGRAVVSTPLETLRDVDAIVRADTAEGFADRLQEIVDGDTDAARSARSAAAQSHSWEARLDQIAEVLGPG